MPILGELYARQGQIDRAIRGFEAILAKSPQHLPTLMILGMLHEQREDFLVRQQDTRRRFGSTPNSLLQRITWPGF